MKFKGSYLFWVCFLLSSIILGSFYILFKQEAVDYVASNRQDTKTPVYLDSQIQSLLLNDDRLDNGHYLVKSMCYKCHKIDNVDSVMVPEADFFNRMFVSIYHGNERKGMPAWKQRLQVDDIADIAAFLTKIRQSHQIKQTRTFD